MTDVTIIVNDFYTEFFLPIFQVDKLSVKERVIVKLVW